VASKRKRREAARRERQRQLLLIQQREAARRRRILIATIAGTTAVVLAIAAIVVIALTDRSDTMTAAESESTPATTSEPVTPTPAPTATGPAVKFRGVTVAGARDLKGMPRVTSKSSKPPTKLEYKDLVVGKGKPASPTSTVTVHYVGVLYKDGKEFDSSWSRGEPAQFPLTGVVKGFSQGIGGAKGIPPMREGGRRILILPASLGYGAEGNDKIPANSPLVFVVDLKSVDS